MRRKAPIIDGRRPDKQYDLDDVSDMLELGLDPNSDLKIADKYVHYRNCMYAVIEFGSTLRKGVEQVESTVKRILAQGRKVDIPIIVVDRLNRFEKRMFKRRPGDKILRERETDYPCFIRAGSKRLAIRLFYSSEVERMYKGLNKYLSK